MPFLARFLSAALLLAPGPVLANTSTLSVQVVVQSSCSVAGATLDFGSYGSGQPADLNGFTRIGYSNCPAGQLRIELDGGTSGSTTARKLRDGRGSVLNYGLYRDSARSQSFGQGSNAKVVTLTGPGSGSVSLYGRIPGGQIVPAGTYTDTVVVTLSF